MFCYVGIVVISVFLLGIFVVFCLDLCIKVEGYCIEGYEVCVVQSLKYLEMYVEFKVEVEFMQGLIDEELVCYEIEQEFFLFMEVVYEIYCGSFYNDCVECKI